MSGLRLLAIDQGSHECGLAYLDGELITADVIVPRASLPWAERMDYIAAQLERAARTRAWLPDVVAIEDVVLHVMRDPGDGMGRTANVKTALTMGETRGYLFRVIRELFPRARLVDVHPSMTKAAVGAPQRRVEAKPHTRRVVAAALHVRFEDLGEDAADAVAIAWAAQTKLGTERMQRLAEQQA